MKNTDKMPDILELANWFLSQSSMTHKKLQKLCYYAVAWGYALIGQKIFDRDEFEAWVHGPVSPVIYQEYKNNGWRSIDLVQDTPKFSDDVNDLLGSVWMTYGDKGGNELEALSHSEKPWKEARLDLEQEDRGSVKISTETMREYYRSIYTGEF